VTRLTGSRRHDRARSHCVRLSIRPVLILPQSGRSDSGECDSAQAVFASNVAPVGVTVSSCSLNLDTCPPIGARFAIPAVYGRVSGGRRHECFGNPAAADRRPPR
jgi:hypothetical protein